MTTARPATFDNAMIAYLPRLRKVSGKLTYPSNKEDLVQSAIEACLKFWKSYDPAKNLGTWMVYQMRSIAYKERQARKPTTSLGLEDLSVRADQEDQLAAADVMRLVDASPHADVLRQLAVGNTTAEIAEMRGVSKQRVHQKIVAFRRSVGRVAA
jgi:RNA polymerase sigma factor (sigma-70 family)